MLVILIAYSVEQLIEPLNNIGGTGFRKQPFIPYFGKIGSDKNPADQNLFERAPYFPVGNPDGYLVAVRNRRFHRKVSDLAHQDFLSHVKQGGWVPEITETDINIPSIVLKPDAMCFKILCEYCRHAAVVIPVIAENHHPCLGGLLEEIDD